MTTNGGFVKRLEVSNARLQPLQGVQQAHSNSHKVKPHTTNGMINIQAVGMRFM